MRFNYFDNNLALNGGALYIESSNSTIFNLEGNVFKDNYAKKFGGAIYLNVDNVYLTTNKNNTICGNTAGILGGGMYSNSLNKYLIITNWTMNNNTINMYYPNDYNSKPAYILLNTELKDNAISITTGDYFPLKFILYDSFDNVLNDTIKYFSFITLKISLEKDTISNYDEYNNDNDDSSLEYKLTGNIGSFLNGNYND